jgi:5-methylcytosine-specific restriction protein A
MPLQVLRPCAQPGCPSLVPKGRCVVHAKAADCARGTAQERGYDSRWAAYSILFRREHPVCGEQHDGTLNPTHSRCLQAGRTTSVEGKRGCVDHIVPVSRGGSFWAPSNHQSLCLACNTAKGDR